jgi:hypothetical protein
MKKLLKNRWVLLITAFLLGALAGGELALRYATAQKFEYDQMLQDHFVESRIWDIATTMNTLQKAENRDFESVLSDNQIFLRGAFLTLVEIHKTWDYSRKNDDMVKSLTRAKKFMAERPEKFLDKKFYVVSVESINNPESEDHASKEATNTAKTRLQNAFEYVDGLQNKPEKTGEPKAGENAPRPTA